jgi:non-ribosomal peptide synthetase component F
MEVLEGDSPKGNDVINKIDPLPWQYTDYVSWQQKTLESAKGKQLSAYWKQELAGELPVLNLPTDRRRPPVQTYEGNSQFIELDETLLEKLRYLGKCEGASLYTLLLAAFLVQLYRYTNQEDILVGSAMAGRSAHQEFKKIVGYFSDPVVLRANLSGNPTFKEFLAQIRGTVFRALRHQDYPFPLLVEQLDANRDLSRPPLFQVAFTWQKHRWYETASNLSGKQGKYLSMKPYSSGLQRGSVLDLNLQIEEAGNSLVANWQYNTDLFDAATISRMAGHFQTLLEAIVANPEQCVAQLPLLTEAERNQLLVEWNNTRTEYPHDKCIHQLFEEQVERTPDNVAVVFEDQKLTYRESNAKDALNLPTLPAAGEVTLVNTLS